MFNVHNIDNVLKYKQSCINTDQTLFDIVDEYITI